MARSRTVKPAFFTNETLAEVEPLGRLLFIGLWTLADREGRLEDRPKRIKVSVLPYDQCDVDALLCTLAEGGFITRYTVGGMGLIQIKSWAKHALPHVKEAPSTLPAPTEHGTSTDSAPDEHGTSTPFNLVPSTGNGEPSQKPAGKITNIDDARKQELAEGFSVFWDAYPRKTGEDIASTAWFTLKPSAELRATIMDALEKHKASQEWADEGGRYIPSPGKWLGERRWRDELTPARPKNPNRAFYGDGRLAL